MIVWAIARDRDDAKTAVMVRIVDGTKRFAAVEVDGLDPFTKTRATLAPKPTRPEDAAPLQILRTGFALYHSG
jgi:hypothetical protein